MRIRHIASKLDRFNRERLSPYLNYHRPCCFPHTLTAAKGRQHKLYRHAYRQTPYEKLKSSPEAERYLRARRGQLRRTRPASLAQSDHETAQALHASRDALFAELRAHRRLNPALLQAHFSLENAPSRPNPPCCSMRPANRSDNTLPIG